MTDTPYNRKIQNFLEEYINCNPDAVYVNGMMKYNAWCFFTDVFINIFGCYFTNKFSELCFL